MNEKFSDLQLEPDTRLYYRKAFSLGGFDAILGLINQKNGLSRHPSGALGITGLQPKYRFQNRQSVF
jgi:hypothetical protein